MDDLKLIGDYVVMAIFLQFFIGILFQKSIAQKDCP